MSSLNKLYRHLLPRPILREQVFRQRLKSFELKDNFDLVFGMDILSFRPAIEFSKRNHAKLILDVNEIPNIHGRLDVAFRNIPSSSRAMINRRTRQALSLADMVVTTGRGFKNYTKEFADVDAVPVFNSRSSKIKPNSNLLRSKIDAPCDATLLVFPNTIARNFGVEATLSALEMLPRNFHLCFIGRFKTDDYEQQIRAEIKKKQLDARTHIITGLIGNEYIRLMSGADIGLIPLDPTIENHRHISPARAYDLIAAEVPFIFTHNEDLLILNEEHSLGAYLPNLGAHKLSEAIANMANLPMHEFRKLKCNVKAAKNIFDRSKGDSEFRDILRRLFKDGPPERAAVICNNGIVNNMRVTRFIRLFQEVGAEVTLFCIEPPKEAIFKEVGAEQPNLVHISVEDEYKDHSGKIKAKALYDWSGDFLKLGSNHVRKEYVVPKLNSVVKSSSRLIGAGKRDTGKSQMNFSMGFAKQIQLQFGSQKYDNIVSHDILAFPAAEHFLDQYDAKHVLDITEIPDMSQRAGRNFREMSDKAKSSFRAIETKAERSSSELYTFCDGMNSYLTNRYNRNVKTMLNARPVFEGEPDLFFRSRIGVPDNAILLVANCTFSPESRPMTCINALKHLPKNVFLLFLGNPTNNGFGKRILRHVKANKLLNRVRFHPPVYGYDYQRILSVCDIGLNIFNIDFDQLRLILPNRVLDLVASKIPFVSVGMLDVAEMVKVKGNGIIVEQNVNARTVADSVMEAIETFGIFGGGILRPSSREMLDQAARSISWEKESDRFVKDVQKVAKGSRLLFLARRRLHSNNRIFRQCSALNEAGFDVHLIGANEGPGESLMNIAPNTRVNIVDVPI